MLASGLCKKPFGRNTRWNTNLSPPRKVPLTEKQFIFHRMSSKSSLFFFPVLENWYFSLKVLIPFPQGNRHCRAHFSMQLLSRGSYQVLIFRVISKDLQSPHSLPDICSSNWEAGPQLRQECRAGWISAQFDWHWGAGRSLHTRWIFYIAQSGTHKLTWLPIHPSKHWYRCVIFKK